MYFADNKAIALAVLIWIGCSLALYFTGMKLFIPDAVKRLSQNSNRTVGRVIGKQADDHERVDYEFVVEGNVYRGEGRGGRGNASFDELTKGTSVIVTYDPGDPKISFLGNPRHDLEITSSVMRLFSIVAPGFPILTLLLLYFAIRKANLSSIRSNRNVSNQ